MIDLRSDTLTMPSQAMLETVLSAMLGDDGRIGANNRGEDATVNALEDRAAACTGKAAAVFFPTGTMGNIAALMTHCLPESPVLVEERQHILLNEQFPFEAGGARLQAICYPLDESHQPSLPEIDRLLASSGAKLLCIENTHNYSGGYCITLERMTQLQEVATRYGAKIHLDGARIFHAAAALHCTVAALCQDANSLMFCISKGLGAPIGSLLCGSEDFIAKSRKNRKLLGGVMRQADVVAAPGLYALDHNCQQLHEDVENAQLLHSRLQNRLRHITLQKEVQSNMVLLGMQASPISPIAFCERARERGLLLLPVELTCSVRMVFHLGISRQDALDVAEILVALDTALS